MENATSRRVALLRAVNVGGHGQVAMADLRDLLARLGLADARSLLRTGNLVFRSGQAPDRLERLLETEAERQLALRTDFFVRRAEEWRAVVVANPFPGEARDDPGHLLVQFLKREPQPPAVEALRAAIRGRERVEVRGRQAYLVYPDGIGRSRLTSAVVERHLGTRATGRNWNTVLGLLALLET